jgi:glycosyltransferase involved in cell wall biosynthesis
VSNCRLAVIIPALNEEHSIGRVLQDIPKEMVSKIIVVDNGSQDDTCKVAMAEGASIISETKRGYGSACLSGLAALPPDTDIVAFMDADYSDHPEQLSRLLAAMEEHQADLVIGSRVLGNRQYGSLTPQQRFGNWLSTRLISLLFGFRYTDLGPFRIARISALQKLKMQDRNYGWTVEMQVKALQHGLKVVEVPVDYRKRIGRSKVSGTISGSFKAGVKILWTIGKLFAKEKFRHLLKASLHSETR